EQGANKGLRAAASLIAKYGLSLDDLKQAVGLSRGKSRRSGPARKVAVKYADGKGNKWTGRGRTPLWLVAAEKAGKKRDSLLIGAARTKAKTKSAKPKKTKKSSRKPASNPPPVQPVA